MATRRYIYWFRPRHRPPFRSHVFQQARPTGTNALHRRHVFVSSDMTRSRFRLDFKSCARLPMTVRFLPLLCTSHLDSCFYSRQQSNCEHDAAIRRQRSRPVRTFLRRWCRPYADLGPCSAAERFRDYRVRLSARFMAKFGPYVGRDTNRVDEDGEPQVCFFFECESQQPLR